MPPMRSRFVPSLLATACMSSLQLCNIGLFLHLGAEGANAAVLSLRAAMSSGPDLKASHTCHADLEHHLNLLFFRPGLGKDEPGNPEFRTKVDAIRRWFTESRGYKNFNEHLNLPRKGGIEGNDKREPGSASTSPKGWAPCLRRYAKLADICGEPPKIPDSTFEGPPSGPSEPPSVNLVFTSCAPRTFPDLCADKVGVNEGLTEADYDRHIDAAVELLNYSAEKGFKYHAIIATSKSVNRVLRALHKWVDSNKDTSGGRKLYPVSLVLITAGEAGTAESIKDGQNLDGPGKATRNGGYPIGEFNLFAGRLGPDGESATNTRASTQSEMETLVLHNKPGSAVPHVVRRVVVTAAGRAIEPLPFSKYKKAFELGFARQYPHIPALFYYGEGDQHGQVESLAGDGSTSFAFPFWGGHRNGIPNLGRLVDWAVSGSTDSFASSAGKYSMVSDKNFWLLSPQADYVWHLTTLEAANEIFSAAKSGKNALLPSVAAGHIAYGPGVYVTTADPFVLATSSERNGLKP